MLTPILVSLMRKNDPADLKRACSYIADFDHKGKSRKKRQYIIDTHGEHIPMGYEEAISNINHNINSLARYRCCDAVVHARYVIEKYGIRAYMDDKKLKHVSQAIMASQKCGWTGRDAAYYQVFDDDFLPEEERAKYC